MSMVRFEIEVGDSTTADSIQEFFTERGMNVRIGTATAYISGMMPSQKIKPMNEFIVLVDVAADGFFGSYNLDGCQTFSDYQETYGKIIRNFMYLLEELMDEKELKISGEFYSYVLDYCIAMPKEFREKRGPRLVCRKEE